MREIKFRAFIKWAKLILEVESIDFKRKRVYCKTELGKPNPCDFYNFDDIELMQYTGLKDKNGIEIYEGDILKYPYVRSSSVNYTIEIGAIEWSDEYCGFIIDEVQNIGGFCGIESKHMNELEVIGNIYENPELFKEGI